MCVYVYVYECMFVHAYVYLQSKFLILYLNSICKWISNVLCCLCVSVLLILALSYSFCQFRKHKLVNSVFSRSILPWFWQLRSTAYMN